MTNIVTMIPVRMASTRLPNKPLLDTTAKACCKGCMKTLKRRCPATFLSLPGDRVIVEACEKFGAKAVLTDPALPSGTDRIAAALKEIDPEGKYDIVVNFQGDAVNVNPAVNNELIAMIERTGCDIATVGMLFDKAGDVKVPSNVKNRDGSARRRGRRPLPVFLAGGSSLYPQPGEL